MIDVDIFNPRREEWDSTWVQDISNDVFREQVRWELDHIDNAKIVIVYFDPATKSPITLMELGILCEQVKHKSFMDRYVIVCCPDGYWRKGNVQIVCDKYGVNLLETFDDMIVELKTYLESFAFE
jgi:hypothetical protein